MQLSYFQSPVYKVDCHDAFAVAVVADVVSSLPIPCPGFNRAHVNRVRSMNNANMRRLWPRGHSHLIMEPQVTSKIEFQMLVFSASAIDAYRLLGFTMSRYKLQHARVNIDHSDSFTCVINLCSDTASIQMVRERVYGSTRHLTRSDVINVIGSP